MTRRVPRHVVGAYARQHFVAGRDENGAVQPVELAHIQLGHWALSPRLQQRPRELLGADGNARLWEHHPVERMIPMRMRQEYIGDVVGGQASAFEALLDDPALTKRADVDKVDVPVAA